MRPFAGLSRTAMAGDEHELVHWRLLAVLYAVSGVLVLAACALEYDRTGPVTLALGIVALAGSVVALAIRPPHPRAVEVGMAAGTAMVAAGTATSPDATFPLYAMFFVWLGVEGALFLTWRAAAVFAATGTFAYLAALLAAGTAPAPAAASWLMTLGSTAVLGGLAWVLRLRTMTLVHELAAAANTDVLTRAPNRRGYREIAGALIADAARDNRPLSVVLGELDDFQALNDEHGHRAGDEALRAFADICRDASRSGDWVARVGGDELAVLLPDADSHGALLVAERLRRSVAARLAELGTPGTVSFGVASSPEHGLSADVLLDSAGQAVAAAKALGRDRTVIFSDQLSAELSLQGRATFDEREHLQAVLVLAETLDLRDESTSRHSHRVGELSAVTARALGLDEARVARIRLAGLLHDIGKIGVPDAVLQKPGSLTDAEYDQIKQHAEIGARILEGANLADLSTWVVAHHERPDGRGYPYGLRHEDIPLEALILGVTDAYEAMTADRVYRPAMPAAQAAAELRRHAGTQFDAEVVDALLSALDAAPVAAR